MGMDTKKSGEHFRREVGLQRFWSRAQKGTVLETVDGRSLLVVSPGTWNVEAGPDFRNAEIVMDGRRLVGDIEIHRLAADWSAHGHDDDVRYRDVILHLVGGLPGADAWSRKNQGMPVAVIKAPRKIRSRGESFNKYPPGDCASEFKRMPDHELNGFFRAQGRDRLMEKSRMMAAEILEKGAEWAFSRKLFETFGYKKNSDNFLCLFDRFQRYEPKSMAIDDAVAVLWGESGLLPDPGVAVMSDDMRGFAEDAWLRWWRIRLEHKESLPWRWSGGRPHNSPCRRVAAAAAFMRRHGVGAFTPLLTSCVESLATPEKIWKSLEERLVCNDRVWDGHVGFESTLPRRAAVLGRGRALDIAVNALLPAAHAKLTITGERDLADKVEKAWMSLPAAQTNIVVKIGAGRWLLPPERARRIFNDLASQQGCLHFFKTHCDPVRTNCAACAIRRFSL